LIKGVLRTNQDFGGRGGKGKKEAICRGREGMDKTYQGKRTSGGGRARGGTKKALLVATGTRGYVTFLKRD